MGRGKISILVRMPNWLGDCVMALPAVAHLTECLPDADVHLAAREQFRPLLAAQPGVKGFLAAPGSGLGALIRGIAEGRNAERKFDAGLLFPNSLSSALWLWGIGAKKRVGYSTDARRIFLTHPVPCGGVEKSRHFVQYYLWLAQFLEGTLAEAGSMRRKQTVPTAAYTLPRLTVAEDARDRARTLLALKGVVGAYAVLAPASAYGEVKDWPPAHYRELTRMLNKELSLPVVVTGGGAQKEVCGAIAANQQNAVSVAGETGLSEFAGLLAGAAAFIGGDSGGAHAAGALGVPTTVIFGITNPTRTRPQGAKVTMIGAGESKDIKLNTPAAREAAKKALESIAPERVFEAVKGTLCAK